MHHITASRLIYHICRTLQTLIELGYMAAVCLPTTTALCRLRRDVDAATEGTTYWSLRQTKCAFQDAVLGANRDAAWDLFKQAWQFFSTLPPAHDLYLRPLFESEWVDGLLRSELSRCIKLELLRHDKGSGLGAMGHKALGGVPGVGKTYIMRGVALVTAAICMVATPVTYDYETAGAAETSGKSGAEMRGALAPVSVLLDTYVACSQASTPEECSAVIAKTSGDLATEMPS
jgi:hypothetical protein